MAKKNPPLYNESAKEDLPLAFWRVDPNEYFIGTCNRIPIKRRRQEMLSLVDLHLMIIRLISDIKDCKNNDLSQYLPALDQIDRILISIDIIAHGY